MNIFLNRLVPPQQRYLLINKDDTAQNTLMYQRSKSSHNCTTLLLGSTNSDFITFLFSYFLSLCNCTSRPSKYFTHMVPTLGPSSSSLIKGMFLLRQIAWSTVGDKIYEEKKIKIEADLFSSSYSCETISVYLR